ncbi:MAG TPA: ABC transporter permease [Anaerolineales bacterium]
MMYLAWRNLVQTPVRLAAGVGGAALALLLILSLDAVFAGVEQRITVYIDNSGADIFVAQEDVRNLHMASSSLRDGVKRKVAAVPGVEAVVPIDYLSNMILVGENRELSYVIGIPENAAFGGPWNISAGKARPAKREAIIDRNVAEKAGVRIGDSVEIMGEDFKVAGLTEETSSLVNSVSFISTRDFEEIRGNYETFSFLLVKVLPGISPTQVTKRIQSEVREVTPQTRMDFAGQERRVVGDMSTDVVTIMNLVGFLIGLSVMALTTYTATLARKSEYGVLKALGARNSQLYSLVLVQAVMGVALGLAGSLILTLGLASMIPRLGLSMVMAIKGTSIFKVAGLSVLIAGIAAVMPIRQISGLDPAMVFRGR